MEINRQDKTEQINQATAVESVEIEARSKKIEKEINETEINEQLATCKQEVNNWKEKFIRAQADLDNFQKRVVKERATWIESAQAKIFIELLNIVDNFDRAFAEQANVEQAEEIKTWLTGFEIIYKSLQKMLETFGVKKMENYKTFDPNFHEALVQVDSDVHESGQIVEVLQQGYMLKDHVLRPAKVSVAK